MRTKILRTLVAGAMMVTMAGAAQAASLKFQLTGLFDITLGGIAYDDLQLTLAGTGYSPLGLTTKAGDPFIQFTSFNAIVPNVGTFAVPGTIVFYFNPGVGPGAGEGGFLDTMTGNKVLIFHSPLFAGYDGQTDLKADGLVFDTAGGFETPFGEAKVIHASGLALETIAAAVPEPASWAMMLGGFGAMGAALRRRPRVTVRLALT